MTSRSGVALSLLGPLECRIGGRVVAVRSRKQRSVLAVLALSANDVVSKDRLIAALWGEAMPLSAKNSLEAHVSRLRKLFGENGAPGALRTQEPGYVLEASTDVQEFERRRASASKSAAGGETEAAARVLEAALELWRGNALADLEDEPFAALEAGRLEELRLVAREQLIGYQLELGHHSRVIPELESLVSEHPLRERFLELLMLALYRSGRQADALAEYRDAERLLRRELGLEPNPSLRALEQAILRHDTTIQAAEPTGRESPAPSDSAPVPPRLLRGRRPRLVLVGGVAALAIVALATVFSLSRNAGARRLTRPQAFGSRLQASISSPLPSCCAFGFDGVWAVGHHDETLEKIDPTTNRIVGRYRVAGFQALEPLEAAGSLWLPAAGGDFVRFDPARGRVLARFPVNVAQVAWGYGSIWATTRDHQLLRINLRTNKIVKRLRLLAGSNDFDDDVAIAYGSVWVTATDTATLMRIDPGTMRIVGSITGFGNTDSWMPLTIGDGSVWIYRLTGKQGFVYRIDPYTNQIVKRIPIGHPNVAWPNGYILDAGGSVWTCDAGNTMTQIDPGRNRVVGWFKLSETCQEVAYGYGSIWTALYDHSRILRIAPS
ncbi:MAG: hypothetical protein QOH23_2725 [Gaiellaceae bacterium]|jgi:DNA-binding SARP family transcriptional activator/streptogramin lyase|nr:hypothetical protein [Gaiellaceae bacterium]